MKTEVITTLDIDTINRVGHMLRDGALVALPTETVYGLGANGLDSEAMERIYQAKGRPSDNPLILHVPNQDSIKRLVKDIPETAHRLMDAFWPGPLTITLPKSDIVPDKATGGLPRVALRCPDQPVCHDILMAAGVPIAAPSANISGRPSPTTAEDVLAQMDGRIEAIVDGGPCPIGVESTVVEVHDNEVIILRPGGITEAMLRTVVDNVSYDSALHSTNEVPKAPGMKYRHYAPSAPMTAYVGGVEDVGRRMYQDIVDHHQPKKTLGLLVSVPVQGWLAPLLTDYFVEWHTYASMDELARILYMALLDFDNKKVDAIYAEGVEAEDLGVAIMNRMDKSTAHHVYTVEDK